MMLNHKRKGQNSFNVPCFIWALEVQSSQELSSLTFVLTRYLVIRRDNQTLCTWRDAGPVHPRSGRSQGMWNYAQIEDVTRHKQMKSCAKLCVLANWAPQRFLFQCWVFRWKGQPCLWGRGPYKHQFYNKGFNQARISSYIFYFFSGYLYEFSECSVVKVVSQHSIEVTGSIPVWVCMKYCYIYDKAMKVKWELNSKPCTNKFPSPLHYTHKYNNCKQGALNSFKPNLHEL